MKLTGEEYEKAFRKLEYTFKKSGSPLIKKLKDQAPLGDDDIRLLVRKLEYTFRKSQDPLVTKLTQAVDEPARKFSNLKAKTNRDEREKLKHLREFDESDDI